MEPPVNKGLTTEQLDALERGDPQVGVGVGKTPVGQPTFSERVVGPKPDARQKLIEEVSSPMERGLAGFNSTLRQLGTQTPPTPEEKLLAKTTAGRVGMAGPAAIASTLGGPSVTGQALFGAVAGAAEPGAMGDRMGNALMGATTQGVGQLLAKTSVKGVNAAAGNLSREGQVASAAKLHGLDLSAGDIADSGLLRLMEEKSIGSPTKGQAGQVAAVMTAKSGDPISNAVMNAYEAANSKVSDLAKGVDAAIAANPKLPGLVPYNTVDKLVELAREYPESLRSIYNAELKDQIQELVANAATRGPKRISFTEMDELRRAVGPLVAKMQRQAQSGASNVTTDAANSWNGLYKSIMEDMENWGSRGEAPQEVLDLHNQMKDTFKNEVLPIREHPIAGKVIDGSYERPEDILRDLTSPRNRSVVADLYTRLDQGGKNAFDALRLMQRGGKEFVKGEPAAHWPRPLTIMSAAALPSIAMAFPQAAASALPVLGGLAALEQGAVHGLNTRLGKAVLGGSSQISQNPLLNSALYTVPRQSMITSGLEALRGNKN